MTLISYHGNFNYFATLEGNDLESYIDETSEILQQYVTSTENVIPTQRLKAAKR